MNDRSIVQHISELVDEEQRLRAQVERPDQHTERIRAIETELDQCWDLLRQRRAKREFGDDPDSARTRDAGTVERYLN
jgi:prefoldin subunit 5